MKILPKFFFVFRYHFFCIQYHFLVRNSSCSIFLSQKTPKKMAFVKYLFFLLLIHNILHDCFEWLWQFTTNSPKSDDFYPNLQILSNYETCKVYQEIAYEFPHDNKKSFSYNSFIFYNSFVLWAHGCPAFCLHKATNLRKLPRYEFFEYSLFNVHFIPCCYHRRMVCYSGRHFQINE